MNLNLVHLDDALLQQPEFIDACDGQRAEHIDLRALGPQLRLWSRRGEIDLLQAALSERINGLAGDQPLVTWLGSGDFHHVTLLLAELRRNATGQPITIVHFDNHPDWVSFEDGMHCGSWVRQAIESGIAERVITLGVSSRDLAWPEFKGGGLDLVASKKLVVFPIDPPRTVVFADYGYGAAHRQDGWHVRWDQMTRHADRQFMSRLIALIETDHVYLTIDKDVLAPGDAHTNWDQGTLTVDDLLGWIRAIAREKRVTGADVVGDYSKPVYGSSFKDNALKRAEALVDQPWSDSRRSHSAINTRTNLQLLETLGAALC